MFMEQTMVISEQSKIGLYFSIKLLDGSVVDSNFGKEAAFFEYGDGSLLPSFESLLLGLKAGDKASFELAAADAFGDSNEQNVMRFSRSQLASYELEVGLVISFADASSSELPGIVKEFDDDNVTVDFNHPLAGQDLCFDVEIVNVGSAAQLVSA